MPFIGSPLDSRSKYGSGSSSSSNSYGRTGSSRLSNNVLDRFGGASKTFDRHVPFQSSTAIPGSKYRSSTLERSGNLGDNSYQRNRGYSSSLGTTTPFGQTSSLYSNGIENGYKTSQLGGSNSNLTNGSEYGKSSKRVTSRSNSRKLFETLNEGLQSDKVTSYARKISETLARHGTTLDDLDQNGSNGTALNTSSNSNTNSQWRKRLEAEEDQERHQFKTRGPVWVVTRATSPQPDKEKQVRTRIARSTDPEEVISRRSRPPRLVNVLVQTDPTPEFGKLTFTDRVVMPSENFDYYDIVKKSVEQADRAALNLENGGGTVEPVTESAFDDDSSMACVIKKAPMMEILPGTTPMVKSVPKKPARPEPEEESEYEYETEEEDGDEEEDESETGLTNGHGNYEDVVDNALEDGSDLDYIDDEDEAEGIDRIRSRVKKKKTFISGMIDIDILLGKDPSTKGLMDDSVKSSMPISTLVKRNSIDFSNAIPSKELETEDKPWWLKSKHPLQYSPSNKSCLNTEDTTETDQHTTADDWTETQDNDISTSEAANDVTITEETWEDEDEEDLEEEEGEEGEEGDWEWEYYSSSKENSAEVEESQENLEPVKSPIDERAPWISDGLANLFPRVPPKVSHLHDTDSEEEEEDGTQGEEAVNGSTQALDAEKGPEQDYNEWLEETAVLQGEVEEILEFKEEELTNISGDDAVKDIPSSGVSPKAEKLVGKIKTLSGTELKRVLFSIKTIFQSDRSLVYDFVKANGILHLIDLSQDEDPQLQNLVLRALGQLMLYVDGMNGVMANGNAIQFLYKLIASPNPLVCKTAIKLILVFVEYSDNNCMILLQAINEVDKAQGNIPWTNVMDVLSKDDPDAELCSFALSLINKTLYGIPDQDTFYDHTDYMEELGMNKVTDNLTETFEDNVTVMQQIQLFNVALKQEDGEPVTEEEISFLDEDATDMGLRTSLRHKSAVVSSHFHQRKSLRYKTRKITDAEVDSTGDIQGVSMRDLELILRKNGLPTSKSGHKLNQLELNGFLEKARAAFVAKISKGEYPQIEQPPQPEPVKQEGDLRWEQILASFDRALVICDLDFSDLQDDEELESVQEVMTNGHIPPPPPAPPASLFDSAIPPPPPPVPNGFPPPIPPPPALGEDGKPKLTPKKHKKTVKLFWREIRNNPITAKTKTVWDELPQANVDTSKVEYLFENRGKDVIIKENKQLLSSQREIIVLDTKRSNAINIGMTKLPPGRVIKTAVLKMDSSIMNREGVEKLLMMLPTEEEVARIQEAHEAQPDIPLGTAEQFLLTLASIGGLEARLRLWSFKMEFEVTEKEVCEPLMDLKMGLESLQKNPTLKTILSVLLTVGNFLNTSSCKGFQLEYLTKVPEVKDTIHKHSLLYHMTYWVLEMTPNCSDMYSEIGPITRSSRTDFEELERVLGRLEAECKLAWEYLGIVTKEDLGHDIEVSTRNKMTDFLNDAAERIIVMNTVYKKVMQKFAKFLLWMGIPPHMHNDYKAHEVCKIISEFSLEFRTTRERVIQTIEKNKQAREKKRLARIAAAETEAKRSSKSSNRRSRDLADDSQLRALLGTDIDVTENGTLRRRKKRHHHRHRSHQVEGVIEGQELLEEGDLKREHRREKKHRRHRSSMMDGTLPITEETLKSFTGTEMERGLLETLMGPSDEGTLKRNKERRRSIKEKRHKAYNNSSAEHELKRSRTRDVWAVMEEHDMM